MENRYILNESQRCDYMQVENVYTSNIKCLVCCRYLIIGLNSGYPQNETTELRCTNCINLLYLKCNKCDKLCKYIGHSGTKQVEINNKFFNIYQPN